MHPHFKKLLSYYKPHLRLLCADLCCASVSAGASLLFPLLTRYITKDVLAGEAALAPARIGWAGVALLLLIAVQNGCMFFTDYQGHAMGARMESAMRSELFAHYQKLSFRFYDGQRTGQLMTRITGDLLWITELCHHGPEDILITLIQFVGAFAILLQINAPLTLAVFSLLPFIGVFLLIYNRKMKRALRRNKDRIGDINAQVEDSLAGIRIVKSFTGEQAEVAKFERENRRFYESRKDGYQKEAVFYNATQAFTQLVTAAAVVFGGLCIVGGTLDLADLLAFTMYIGSLMAPIHKAANFLQLYQEGFTGFERFLEMMEVEPDIVDKPGAAELPAVRGDIALREVRFRYSDEGADILRGLNLDIRAGEYVALVGPSGVGKTTLCSLIPRFYDVCEGSVTLDGVDVRGIRLQSLRRSVGIVQQDVYLFAGTVMENILYGRPGASRRQAVEAAKRANAHEFIASLPNGYDTDIGQRGVRLSGGQKQRICIARVLLKDPPVLIFDEATSSLDNESERAVQESLELLAKGRTTLVIAHRLSTIRHADRILVLGEDGVAESGTHDELCRKGGLYARLYQMQFQF